MKKLKFIGLIFLLTHLFEIKAQTYYPLLGDSNEWNIVTCVFEGVETFKYLADRDTIIDATEYKILEEDLFEYDSFLTHGFLREDTINKKVYIRTDSVLTGINKEYIYLDFSMDVGDSIQLYNVNWRGIDSIGYFHVDSINILNTLAGERKALYLSGENYYYLDPYPDYFRCGDMFYHESYPAWVEGVGSLSNPTFPHTEPNINYEIEEYSDNALSCYYKNGIHVFQAEFSLLTGCIISDGWGAINEKNAENEINIYPVPSGDKITIVNNSQYAVSVNLFDLTGRNNITIQLGVLRNKTIDISSLPAGIYILRYYSRTRLSGYIKLIKEY